MGDRFLDDAKIKKSSKNNPQLQVMIEKAKQLRNKAKQKIDSLSPEELSQITNNEPINIKETAQQIQEKLNVPIINPADVEIKPNIPFDQQMTLDQLPEDAKISHELTMSTPINTSSNMPVNVNTSTNMAVNANLGEINKYIIEQVRQEPEPIPLDTPDISNAQIIKSQQEAISEDKLYEREVNKILQQNPELAPKSNASISIEMKTNSPQYVVSKEDDKVVMETKQFKNMNKKISPLQLDANILLEKYRENKLAFEAARIELEIYSRMIASTNDESLRLNVKLAEWQRKLKEAELRQTVIANILAGK